MTGKLYAILCGKDMKEYPVLLKRPRIILNMAQTLNGYISGEGGARVQISSQEDMGRVMKLRDEVDAIMIGGNTMRLDNPYLRSDKCRYRIVITSKGKIPDNANLLGNGNRLIVINEDKEENDGNISYISAGRPMDLRIAMNRLYEKGIRSILLEGGKTTAESFLKLGMVDVMYLFVGYMIMEGKGIHLFDHNKRIKDIIEDAVLMNGGVLLRLNPIKLGESL
jgi:2,5-diamino-6-(ribosylamino)-4(3H)-pyrimidinone 5'-phosphate reductase